ncbi:MAG: hypothetical protein J5527_02445 [Treponema sp.]|nr:hypothetical protein [Treponema sp.]
MKHIKTLFVLTLLCGIAFAFSSCQTNPTAGLDEISFEEILKADLYDEYNSKTETITYNTEGQETSHDTESGVVTGAEVKAYATVSKGLIEGIKILTYYEGRVCANKKYSKIVIYFYTKTKDGTITSEVITTYTKK